MCYSPRSFNSLSLSPSLRPKEKKETAKTLSPRPTSSTNNNNKNPTKRRTGRPATILTRLPKETHTEKYEANAYFDQQVSSTESDATRHTHARARAVHTALPGYSARWLRVRHHDVGDARSELQMADMHALGPSVGGGREGGGGGGGG